MQCVTVLMLEAIISSQSSGHLDRRARLFIQLVAWSEACVIDRWPGKIKISLRSHTVTACPEHAIISRIRTSYQLPAAKTLGRNYLEPFFEAWLFIRLSRPLDLKKMANSDDGLCFEAEHA